MNGRITYFDFLRAVAIIGVVAIHTTSVGYNFPDDSFNFTGTVIWRQIINFAVPLFLAISGFFVFNKNVENKTDHLTFLKKQVPKVFIPYLLWSILYLGLQSRHGFNPQTFIYKILTFQATEPFYFILLILQYYLLLPILKKWANKKGLILAAFISIIWSIVAYVI